MGVCLASGSNTDFEILYHLADQALYQSKTEGRQMFHVVKNSCELPVLPDNRHTTSVPVKLSEILSSIDSGIALLEIAPPFHMIYANPYFRSVTGIGGHPVNGQDLATLIHPEDRSCLKQILNIRKTDSLFVQNIRVLTALGKYMWIRIHISTVSYDEQHRAYMISASDISELKEKERRLENINERLQTAFDQTGQGIWEVDLPSRRFRMYDDGFGSSLNKKALAFPEALISSAWVHPDSVPMLRKFAKDIYDGTANGYGNFILRYPDAGTYQWAALSYTLLHDHHGNPTRAVGIIETLFQDLHGIQSLNYPHRYVPEALVPYLIFHVRANLSENTIKDVWSEGKYMTGNPEWITCTQVFSSEMDKIPDKENRIRFCNLFHPTSLLHAYEQGKHWLLMEYPRIDGHGTLQWCCFTVGMYKNGISGNICMFSFLYRSEQRYHWETELKLPVERDPSTLLYTKDTGLSMTQMLLNRHWENMQEQIWEHGSLCASVLLIVNGLADLEISDKKKLRFYVASALNSALGTSQITSAHGHRKFFSFFPSIASKEKLLRKLEQAFDYIRCSLSGIVPADKLHFIACACCISPDKINADMLLKNVEELGAQWEGAASDKIIFTDEPGTIEQKELYVPGSKDHIWFHREPHRRPLTEKEKDILLKCVSGMLLSDALSDSMRNVLELLGKFYKADRAYFLLLSGKKHVADIPCEWDSSGITEIQSIVSGQTLDMLPLVELCANEQAPLFLTRSADKTASSAEWRYMLLPMLGQTPPSGYLCIENAKNSFSEDALPDALIPYIVREYQRYQSIRTQSFGFELHLQKDDPQISEYTNTASLITSDTYSSLGVLCIEIPEFPALNATLGFEYGRAMLRFISQSAAATFGRNLLFRTWDSEFTVLCPNTTEQVFLSKYGRLKRKLFGRYPGKIRIGQKWTESHFNGKDLAEQVRSEMRRDKG